MGKNLANLGIAWYSDDKKVQNDIGSLQGSLEGIKDTLGAIKRVNAIGAIVDAVSMDKLRAIKAGVSELASGNLEAAGAAGPLDSMYAQAAKSASQLAASSSKVSENMKGVNKSVGLARSLNIDANAVQKIAAEFTKLETNATKYGFESMKDFVKMTQVAEVEGENLVRTLKGLETGFNFSGKGAGKLLDEVTYIGREFGFGTDAVKQFETVTGSLNEHLRYMGEDAGPEEFSEMTRQIYLLAGGMVKLGKDPADAMSEATETFTKLAGAKGEMRAMFTGKGGLPDLLQQGAISIGDFGKMQDMMNEKPLDFIMSMGEHFDKLGSKQQEFLRQNVLKDMGADTDWFIQGNWKQVAPAIDKVKNSMDKASGSAQKMGKHFRTGRTYTERLNMVTEDYQQSISDLTKNALGNTFIKRQRNFYMGMLAPAFESMTEGTFKVAEGVGFINKQLDKTGTNASITKEQLGGIQEVLAKGFLGFRASGFEGLMVAAMDAEPAIKAISKYAKVTTDTVKEANEDGYVAQFTLLWKAAKGYLGSLKPMLEDVKGKMKEMWDDFRTAHPTVYAIQSFFSDMHSKAVKLKGVVEDLFGKAFGIDPQKKKDLKASLDGMRGGTIGGANFMNPMGSPLSTGTLMDDMAMKDQESLMGAMIESEDFKSKEAHKKLGVGIATMMAGLPLSKFIAGAIPGGGILMALLGVGAAAVHIDQNMEGGIEAFIDKVAAKIGPLIDKASPHLKKAADALGKLFSKLASMIDWNKVGEKLASGVSSFVSALGSAISYAFSDSKGQKELEGAAKNGDMTASLAVAMGKAFEGLGGALKGMGKGILTSLWQGVVGKPEEDKEATEVISDAGKTVAGMFVAGILTGIAATFTRSKILGVIGRVLRAPISIPFKFVARTTKAATKGYLTAKGMAKAGELAQKFGFADDVAAAEARVAAASTSKEARAAKFGLGKAKAGAKLRGAGTKVIGGVDKAVAKSGMLGKVLGLEDKLFKFKQAGQFLQSMGGAAPEAAKSMTFMKSMKNVLGQSKVVKFFKFLGKSAKAIGKALAPIAKFASKIVTPIILIWEYMKRLPDIVSDFGSLFSDALDPDELTKKGWSIAKNFLGILDAFFLNIPSWIGEKLGITTEIVEAFYQFLSLKTYETIEYVAAFFGSMGDRVEGIYYGVKSTAMNVLAGMGMGAVSTVSGILESFFSLSTSVVNIWHDIAKVGAVKFAEMLGQGNSFVNDLVHAFGSLSNIIIFDVLEPITRAFSKVFTGILDLIMELPGAEKAIGMLGFDNIEEFKSATNLHEQAYGKNVTDKKIEKMKKKRLSDLIKTDAEMKKEKETLVRRAEDMVKKSRQVSHQGISAAKAVASKGLGGAAKGFAAIGSRASAASDKSRAAYARKDERFAQADRNIELERARARDQTLGTLKGPGTAKPSRPDGIRPGQGRTPEQEAMAKSAKANEETANNVKELVDLEKRKAKRKSPPPRVTGPENP